MISNRMEGCVGRPEQVSCDYDMIHHTVNSLREVPDLNLLILKILK